MDIICSLLEEEFTVVSVGRVVELKKKSVVDNNKKRAAGPDILEGVWSDVFDLLDDIVFIQDDRFRVVKANKAAQEFFGFSTSSPKDTYCYNLLAGEDSSCAACPFRDHSTTDMTSHSEMLHKKSGILLAIKSSRITHPEDGNIYVVQIAKTISPESSLKPSETPKYDSTQGVEKELYKQKALFETIFNSLTDGVIITDINRVIQVANDGVLPTFGYRPEDLVGRSAEVLYAQRNVFDEVGDKLFTEDADKNKLLHQAKYRHRTGRIFLGEAFGTKLYNSHNEWIGNLGIMRDITDRNKDEKELRGLNAAIEQISDVVMIADYLGNITYVNSAFEEVTGFTKAEVIGRNPRLLQSGQHDKDFYQGFWKLITHGKTFTGRMVNKRKNGECYTEESTISPIVDKSGKVVSYVAIKRDITKQQQLESQLHQAQKMESVGRLTGGVAHDFNNILGVILGYAGMALRNSEPTDKLYNDLKIIHDAANRSADIVRQLLMFSRQQTIAPEVIDINSGVDGMLNMLRRLIGEDIELRWQPYPNILTIKIDPSQVDQILANLCVNARDAIAGTGKLTITTEKRVIEDDFLGNQMIFSPGDEVVQLRVTDNGEGIDKGEIDKIFEPFFTTKEKGQGTGLGLSTVYGIVQQNYGDISVTSSKGEGTCFTILFPLTVEPLSLSKGSGLTRLNEGQNETILLVEDDLTLLDMTSRMLEKTGYNVLTASGGSEALRLADKNEVHIDLLLTDVVMPEMNGKELSEKIEERIPGIKILYMSGYTSNVLGHNGVLDEGFELVTKPFSRKGLTDKIREMLDL